MVKKYTEKDIVLALEAMRRTNDKLTLCKASQRFGIPKTTLHSRNLNDNLGFHGSYSVK